MLYEYAAASAAAYGVQLSGGCGKLPQQLLLGGTEIPWHCNIHGYELVASAAASEEGYALASEPEYGSGLSALGYGELHLAVQSGYLDFST